MKNYNIIFVYIFFTFIFQHVLFSQVNPKFVGQHQYAQWSGEWYTVNNGEKGDGVDIKHIIVKLKNNDYLSSINFNNLKLPILKNVRGRFAGNFYEL